VNSSTSDGEKLKSKVVNPGDLSPSPRITSKAAKTKKRPQSALLSPQRLKAQNGERDFDRPATERMGNRRYSSPVGLSPINPNDPIHGRSSSTSNLTDSVKKKKPAKKPTKKALKKLKLDNTNTSEFPFGALVAKNPTTGEEELIFMSVIDTLTEYNFNKKLAHFFKKFKWDSETLSTVRAEFYAKRFSDFMLKNLLHDEVAIDVPSDEEEDFKQHVEGMARAGKLPRAARVRSTTNVTNSSNMSTTLTTTTTTTTVSEKRSRKTTFGNKLKNDDIPEESEKEEENGNSKKNSTNYNTSKENGEDEPKKKKKYLKNREAMIRKNQKMKTIPRKRRKN